MKKYIYIFIGVLVLIAIVLGVILNRKVESKKQKIEIQNKEEVISIIVKEETEGGYIYYKTEDQQLIKEIVNALNKIEIKEKTDLIFSDNTKTYILRLYDGTILTYSFQSNYYHKDNINYEIDNYKDLMKIKLPIDKNENNNSIKYSKYIDDIKLELDIPNEWKYEEISKNENDNFFKYALKLYRSNKEQYAMLYFYNSQFGVCGTGRTTEKLILNNNQEASIGYYDNSKVFQDISFSINKNIALVNNGLTYDEAEELLEIIKTINIT